MIFSAPARRLQERPLVVSARRARTRSTVAGIFGSWPLRQPEEAGLADFHHDFFLELHDRELSSRTGATCAYLINGAVCEPYFVNHLLCLPKNSLAPPAFA